MHNLTCHHCSCMFLSRSIETRYCSSICRSSGRRSKREILTYGPCPTCKKIFDSVREKRFCSIKCYTTSEEFLSRVKKQARTALEAALAKRGQILREREERQCLECGVAFYSKPSDKRHWFCSRAHYRSYMAKRFDRWVASPQSIALPQNYDEFLTQEELPCLVEGCSWVGKSLGFHVNAAHGITAEEFKRAAGFNKGTGLVTPELSEKIASRPHLHIPISERPWMIPQLPIEGSVTRVPLSLEAREHAVKSRALLKETSTGPERSCRGCNKKFVQNSPLGLTKFCSVQCRQDFYTRNHRRTNGVCAQCGCCFLASYVQTIKIERHQSVFCSSSCRNRYVLAVRRSAKAR